MRYNTRDSPFIELQTPFTAWEAIKLVIMLPTVPVRAVLFVLSAICVAVCNSLAVGSCDLEQPLPPWRRRLVELSSRFFCGAMLRAAGFWWPRRRGMQHWEEGRRAGAIGVFNHVGYTDAFVCTWAFCAAGLTFEFTKHVPILGRGIQALQNIYLPSDKSKQAASMVEQLKKRATMPGMPPFVVAPEGTLSHGRCLLIFKTGAFVAGLPVVPILYRYKLTGHNPGWGVILPKWHLLRLMTQLYNHVEVECLPVYYPSSEEKASPALYAANVRALMARRLGVPLVDQDRGVSVALEKAGIRPSWDGRRVTAPPGVIIDEDGYVDIGPWLPHAPTSKTK